MFGLNDKVAVVTGAGNGLGREICLRLCKEGASVVAADIDDEGLKQTLALAEESPGRITSINTDVTDEDQVKAMVDLAVESFGSVSIGVNAAGIEPVFAPVHELGLKDWNKTVAVNLTGTFLCMKHEIQAMRAGSAGGSIINFASVAAQKLNPNTVDYAASKRGISAVTSVAALENATLGIRANTIMPGAIKTRMLEEADPAVRDAFVRSIPMGTLGEPRQIADAVLWLASDMADYVTGQYFAIDGGIIA